MSINKILVTLSAVATCMLHACNSTGCTDNKISLPLAGFYSYQTLQPVTIQNISVGAVNAPNDSLLIEAGNASKLYLPFNIGENTTTFFIRYLDEGLNNPRYFDTVTFNYNRIPYFASEECGAMYQYEVVSYTHTSHHIDSVSVPRPVINNIDRESIQLFFRTFDTNQEEDEQQP